MCRASQTRGRGAHCLSLRGSLSLEDDGCAVLGRLLWGTVACVELLGIPTDHSTGPSTKGAQEVTALLKTTEFLHASLRMAGPCSGYRFLCCDNRMVLLRSRNNYRIHVEILYIMAHMSYPYSPHMSRRTILPDTATTNERLRCCPCSSGMA